jgi:hypothetical protein
MRRVSLLVFALVPVLTLSPLQARGLNRTSFEEYRTHLENLRGLLAACEAKPAACDAGSVGPDEQVQLQGLGSGANADSFEAHYEWLRDALKSAQNAGNKNRNEELRTAGARLDDNLREASGEPPAQAEITAARRGADTILGHPEFTTVREDSLWQRLLARLAQWLDSFFTNVAQFGSRSPWIGPVVEWGLVGVALVALALWAMRVLGRQRLAVRAEAARQIEPWEEAARNWRELAEEQAGRGEWREAVHCLYWASIAVLEGRRVWAPSRSRTPREYVRLLEAGSARWKLLRLQTHGFEHVWYGLRNAGRQEYESALALHEELRVA